MRWIVLLLLVLSGCIGGDRLDDTVMNVSGLESNEKLEVATFAGGCFWCMEASFELLDGVEDAVSGYTGGLKMDPTYAEVSSGSTGHYEAVNVYYDPDKISYSMLVDQFFKNIDPTDSGGQFADRGSQYLTAVFYHDGRQKKIVEDYISKLDESGKFDKPVVTEVLPYEVFYPAEEYHQSYYEKNPGHYMAYKKGSGREDYVEKTWGK